MAFFDYPPQKVKISMTSWPLGVFFFIIIFNQVIKNNVLCTKKQTLLHFHVLRLNSINQSLFIWKELLTLTVSTECNATHHILKQNKEMKSKQDMHKLVKEAKMKGLTIQWC